MTYLLFAVALSLSVVAAWYAIAGLMAIFAAAAIPIAIMGSLLEAAKLVTASWLYRSWNEIPKLFKAYFVIAVAVLMMLTSMGIFGFLSKAHLDQTMPTGDFVAQIELIDEKINLNRENINEARRTLEQLDQQINRFTELGAVTRGVNTRRDQADERAGLLEEIRAAQEEIARLNQEKAPLAREVRAIEAEVGPIKYIAALIYGDNTDSDILEKSVRVVILLIVAVFDPLAVLLLVAANWNLKNQTGRTSLLTPREESVKEIKIEDEVQVKEEPVIETSQPQQDVKEEPSLDSELPEIHIEDAPKEWEPELYARHQKKIVGRHMQETGQPPPKTVSFMKKVQSLFESSGVKTIEKEVDELQKTQQENTNNK